MISFVLSALTGGLGWVKGALKDVKPSTIAIIALTASCALLWLNASGWKGRAVACETAAKESTRLAKQNKARTETRNDAATKTQDKADAVKTDDFDSRLAAYLRLHPAPRRQPSVMPETPDAPGSPVEADTYAIVPATDLATCKDAVIKGQSFDSWWPTVSRPVEPNEDGGMK